MRSKGEAMTLVINLKQALKHIDTIVKTQWYNDNKDLIELKYELTKKLESTEELISNGELPDTVIEEWNEKTEQELKLMGIKITKV